MYSEIFLKRQQFIKMSMLKIYFALSTATYTAKLIDISKDFICFLMRVHILKHPVPVQKDGVLL